MVENKGKKGAFKNKPVPSKGGRRSYISPTKSSLKKLCIKRWNIRQRKHDEESKYNRMRGMVVNEPKRNAMSIEHSCTGHGGVYYIFDMWYRQTQVQKTGILCTLISGGTKDIARRIPHSLARRSNECMSFWTLPLLSLKIPYQLEKQYIPSRVYFRRIGSRSRYWHK